MSTRSEPENTSATLPASGNRARPATAPGMPRESGYAEPKPAETTERDKPNPEAAGSEASQVAAAKSGEVEDDPADTEPTPPGEHKREPIKDPDPADSKLHVGQHPMT